MKAIIKDIVEVQWEDGHKSAYNLKWLKERSFLPKEQQGWLNANKAPYNTWDANHFKSIPVLNYKAVLRVSNHNLCLITICHMVQHLYLSYIFKIQDDDTLLDWLNSLDVWGVCLLKNVPHSLGQVTNIAKRVGFIKKTHYG
jgi:gamma-butyrobetaine dioxygenase